MILKKHVISQHNAKRMPDTWYSSGATSIIVVQGWSSSGPATVQYLSGVLENNSLPLVINYHPISYLLIFIATCSGRTTFYRRAGAGIQQRERYTAYGKDFRATYM